MLSGNYDISHVDAGQAALNSMSKDRPGLMLLDVVLRVDLPSMTDYQICRALHEATAIGTRTKNILRQLKPIGHLAAT